MSLMGEIRFHPSQAIEHGLRSVPNLTQDEKGEDHCDTGDRTKAEGAPQQGPLTVRFRAR